MYKVETYTDNCGIKQTKALVNETGVQNTVSQSEQSFVTILLVCIQFFVEIVNKLRIQHKVL